MHDAHAGHGRHAAHAQHTGADDRAIHDAHAGHGVAMFRDKFWINAAPDAPDARLGTHATAGA